MMSDRDLCGEVYNIGPDDNEITIKGLAMKIGHLTNVYPNLEHHPDRPQRLKMLFFSYKIKRL